MKHMITSERERELFVRGYERGLQQGIEMGRQLVKSVLRLENEGYEVSDIAEKLQISEDEVRQIIEE